jgi:UDPglucose 6-dehydrogenase
VVVGDDGDWAGDAVVELYAPLDAPLVRTDVKSAEMVKLASNAFLATKISFINEIANVCEETGADVVEVARGMGLDDRIGPKFLQAGIGFGGSCFAGDQTVLARLGGQARLLRLDSLWRLCGGEDEEALAPPDLEVLSWVPGEAEPEYMSVSLLTRRDYDGDMVEVRTKMGRRLRTTADHPFVVGTGRDEELLGVKPAGELDREDWLPLALGGPSGFAPRRLSLAGVLEDRAVEPERVRVRPAGGGVAVRLPQASDTRDATFGTASNGVFTPLELEADEHFWRVVGLYLAEGCVASDGARERITWSFHPTREQHLVDEVVAYWQRHGIAVHAYRTPTAKHVEVSSRILAAWWTSLLGLGRNSYAQRLPDLIWEQTIERKRALLSALWEGDGSWSLVNGGPSVILEWGTVSDELAEGVARLLADVGLVCAWRRGRAPKSTKETHWLRVSGADQVEHGLFLVPERDRPGVLAAIGRQARRIAPTGYRRFDDGAPWVRVVETRRERFRGPVYSLEVPGSHTVVANNGISVHQCFPKDVTALKQLAGNSGYHFQLLNSVIEVNELQKRRVIAKLEKHLGSLIGKEIALLGLAFKPNTDDMREASSLVLSARLQAAGARVRAYDPVAEEQARKLITGVDFKSTAREAVTGADAVVLVTEWPEFKELDLREVAGAMRGSLLIDGRNVYDPADVREAGLAYEGIGRAARNGG